MLSRPVRNTWGVQLDHEQCYRAVESRDARFDGWFVTAVRTTKIYCRPSCPAISPKRQNVDFFTTGATAQQRGYRACKRCRPDATPGSPEWSTRSDVVGRAMRLIADGVVDREGVSGLAARLSYSERQVHRLLTTEVGTGPIALARAQRAQTARLLIETTTLPITQVAFAAGFSSVRQFNDTVKDVYATTPTLLRASCRTAVAGSAQLTIRLAVRQPFQADRLLSFFATRAVRGVESFDGSRYSRSLRLDRGAGVVAMSVVDGIVHCSLWLDQIADVQAAVQRCRRMFDLDADPMSIDERLATDSLLAPLVATRPGLRSPGHPDGAELLTRAILGQQVSVKGARTLAERLVALCGEPLLQPVGDITHLFPSADAVARRSPSDFAMPTRRGAALIGANQALADGAISIDPGSDRDEVYHSLCGLPGIGPWTASYVLMRSLNDPDVFLPTDIGVRNALRGIDAESTPRAAADRADGWRPWRSYALHHLWATL